MKYNFALITSGILLCASADPSCKPNEKLVGSSCTACPNGQVGYLSNYVKCDWCPAGSVRGNDVGTGTGTETDGGGTCVPAGGICDPNEKANEGKCIPCPNGQVGNLSDYLKCDWCLAGSVRGNDVGTGTGTDTNGGGTCITAGGICDPNEKANEGKCIPCPNGQVGHLSNYVKCDWCPASKVRGNDAGTGTGISGSCVDAVGICDPNEKANEGKCIPCPDGQVGHLSGYMRCDWCPAGFVRGDQLGSTTGEAGFCTNVCSVCDPDEKANEGKCISCPDGQVGNLSGHVRCDWCPPGFVRGNDAGTGTGIVKGLCVAAGGICDPNEKANEGKCIACPSGQVGNLAAPSYSRCVWCPAGKVRGNDVGTGTGTDTNGGGTCVDAGGICDPNETANEGKCIPCPNGQVGHLSNYVKCDWCPAGKVRGNDVGTGTGTGTDTNGGGTCVAADGICDPNEKANEGKCIPCPDGQVGHLSSYMKCDWCPAGKVRGNDTGTGTGTGTDTNGGGTCVAADGICDPNEKANEGKCIGCPDNQVGYLSSYVKCDWGSRRLRSWAFNSW